MHSHSLLMWSLDSSPFQSNFLLLFNLWLSHMGWLFIIHNRQLGELFVLFYWSESSYRACREREGEKNKTSCHVQLFLYMNLILDTQHKHLMGQRLLKFEISSSFNIFWLFFLLKEQLKGSYWHDFFLFSLAMTISQSWPKARWKREETSFIRFLGFSSAYYVILNNCINSQSPRFSHL